ncbi:MAG: TIGR03618 family F420-dependent PPOX class oxidoreductase [Nonomuraea sp.]|nr:TIGR03618 family F420-dependent PPOX class oxidoreductase [Nonomuraea sp.]NUP68686.1 TIGR03618 family F420-dependent PPOX class oxidoreductase [Nonomuraea sp.]NUP76525.1 TIGR03618 family F420-dependent PPOX class oxidoreductase [Nonomuraea sp.]NUS03480.1 TIGR03618 family F420-dependent PPOX class oxidoreductase [Nonomuraea sp.]
MSQETYEPEPGPGARALTDEEMSALLSAQRFGALATNRSSGHPHLSTVVYSWDPRQRVVRVPTVADRVKVRQLHKDPRGALYVASDDFWSYAVAEGEAELSPVSDRPGDEVGQELLAMQPPFGHPAGEEAFLRQMVADRRLVIRLRVRRLYGTILPTPS